MSLEDQVKTQRPLRLAQTLFIAGLAFYTSGQVMIALGRGFVDALAPIDFAHWALLIGATLMIHYAVSLNRTVIQRTASFILLIGIVGIIGMCVIDFIIWSYPLGEQRIAFIQHVSAAPTIWEPFILLGPWLFGIGIVLGSLPFVAKAKVGVTLVIIGSVISAMTTSWLTVLAYVLIMIGYILCFRHHFEI